MLSNFKLFLEPPNQPGTEPNRTTSQFPNRGYRLFVGEETCSMRNQKHSQRAFDLQANDLGDLPGQFLVYQNPVRFDLSGQQDDIHFALIEPQKLSRQRRALLRTPDGEPICLGNLLGTWTATAFPNDFFINRSRDKNLIKEVFQ